MFYEKTFYDSPRIDTPRIEQSLLGKTSTSLVYSSLLRERWHGIKRHVTSTCVGPNGQRLIPALPWGMEAFLLSFVISHAVAQRYPENKRVENTARMPAAAVNV